MLAKGLLNEDLVIKVLHQFLRVLFFYVFDVHRLAGRVQYFVLQRNLSIVPFWGDMFGFFWDEGLQKTNLKCFSARHLIVTVLSTIFAQFARRHNAEGHICNRI